MADYFRHMSRDELIDALLDTERELQELPVRLIKWLADDDGKDVALANATNTSDTTGQTVLHFWDGDDAAAQAVVRQFHEAETDAAVRHLERKAEGD